MRYRLQYKEPISKPYVIGNRSYPYPTFRWKDIAISDDANALEAMIPPFATKNYRIEDTRRREIK